MNGFEKHNIKHLSASSLNLWANAPDIWVAQYLFGERTGMGAAAWRGIMVEDAVVEVLTKKATVDAAVARAVNKFNDRFAMQAIADEKIAKERDAIDPMVRVALAEIEPLGAPEFPHDGKQEKIVLNCKFDDWSIPIIGFLDLVFPESGLIIDLKTTNRIPSQMSAEHQLQRAIYAKAKGNFAVKFCYVSAKKSSILEDGDVNEILRKIKVAIRRLEAFLAHCDKETARAIVPLTNNFYSVGADEIKERLFGL